MNIKLRIMAVMLLLAAQTTRAETNTVSYVWGKETDGLRLGLRVESAGATGQDLHSFTLAVTNCSSKPIILPDGDSWHGPNVPQYTFEDPKKKDYARSVFPPHIFHTGHGITHIANPISVALAPGEAKCIHHSTFVPPVPVGTWSVLAQFHAHTDRWNRISENKRDPDLWRGMMLDSGCATVTITSEHKPPPWPPCDNRLFRP